MDRRKYLAIARLFVTGLIVLALGTVQSVKAQPSSPTDESKVPHYFGPYPNWANSPAIPKFVDGLPGLGPSGANNLGQYLPVAIPDTTTYPGSDYYEIGLVQYREKMHSNLPATLLRGYVQLSTSIVPGAQVPLSNALLDGTSVPIANYTGVTAPHYLGPVIAAAKDRPVRILFRNLLPTGSGGDLFLPVDSTVMGSGMGPMNMGMPVDQGSVMDAVRNPLCTSYPKSDMCFKDNRATLHLHGGVTPWISDGTPHQWTTPAGENTAWPKGVSVSNVPDMSNPGPGALTFYYTNQQSARLMFYHDHAWGITRLNVYAGEAAGYLIADPIEQKLIADGTIPADQIPLIIQDRTFVPSVAQLASQDPTWDSTRWGNEGNLWYHHVYMPAQNPSDPTGMSGFGRWMYGPWFWPPAKNVTYPPISNPYYDPNCDPNIMAFCEPALIPGTPNISVGMEQFNDTPIVNGTAYPTITIDPKPYRLRILNAANDRFWNLQWYEADPNQGDGKTEVALKAAEVAAAQNDPVVFPTPDTTISPAGPSWVQIATEGGFLPAPVVIPNQPITWITDPTRFDVGNVDLHSLLLAPAERADVIVDFSQYAGKTLILYNDAPAAFPARVPSYDYYTGAPDLGLGAPLTVAGYGPNTRTIMQVVVNSGSGPSFNLANLQTAFAHKADKTGVFESGQHPIIVGQAAYNSAYGTDFAASGWCNSPTNPSPRCDGFARISEQGGDLFGFNTLSAPTAKLQIPFQPKAIHDEMNAVSFDEYGRMTANLGLEAVPAAPGLQNVILYPYVNPATELINATNLPKGDINVTPIATADGTQIWKITHNGVDTHPIHFHLYDVQVVNRVTWDNIIIPPDPNELGWKDTVRVSPLEDTIVALRPIIPTIPFEIPNSVRLLNPMMPEGSTLGFNSTDANGNPTNPIINVMTNFGWEYVWHCHILSHEEMDMMRPVSIAIPPKAPTNLSGTRIGNGRNRRVDLVWTDNSVNETGYKIQRALASTGPWTDLASVAANVTSYADPIGNTNQVFFYQVIASNLVGYTGVAGYPTLEVTSTSNVAQVPLVVPPAAPSSVLATAALQGNSNARVTITWTDNANNETGFTIQRATNAAFTANLVTSTVGANVTTFTTGNVARNTPYYFRIQATNGAGASAWVNAAPFPITTP
jgi:FtsP/CotA-like multicopper oxidase with cupredoxin domain